MPTERPIPEVVDRILGRLREWMPETRVSYAWRADYAQLADAPGGVSYASGVRYRFEGPPGIGYLVLDRELMEDEPEQAERFVEQIRARLAAGISWRISADGTATKTEC